MHIHDSDADGVSSAPFLSESTHLVSAISPTRVNDAMTHVHALTNAKRAGDCFDSDIAVAMSFSVELHEHLAAPWLPMHAGHLGLRSPSSRMFVSLPRSHAGHALQNGLSSSADTIVTLSGDKTSLGKTRWSKSSPARTSLGL